MAGKRSKKPATARRAPARLVRQPPRLAPRIPMPGATMTRRAASEAHRCVWGGGRYDPEDRSDVREEMVCGCAVVPGQAYCLKHVAALWSVAPAKAKGLFADPGADTVLLHR